MTVAFAGNFDPLPLGSAEDRAALELSGRGLLPGLQDGVRPWMEGEVRSALERGRQKGSVPADDPALTALYSWLETRLRHGLPEGDTLSGPYLRLDATGSVAPNSATHNEFNAGKYARLGGSFNTRSWGAHISYFFDEALLKDPNYRGRRWAGFAGGPEYALLSFQGEALRLSFGTSNQSWGWGRRGSMILSQDSPYLPQVSMKVGTGILTAGAFHAYAGVEWDSSFAGRGDYHRFVGGHRVELTLGSVQMAASEVILYATTSEAPNWHYFFPLVWYLGEMHNSVGRGNDLVQFDVRWRARVDLEVLGTLMIDDVQIERKKAGDREPPEIGLEAGLRWHPMGWTWSLWYQALMNRTYVTTDAVERYQADGVPLGYREGPDGDRLSLTAEAWTDWPGRLVGELRLSRQGQGGLWQPWDEPWMTDSTYAEPFPTGTVETALRATFTAEALGVQAGPVWVFGTLEAWGEKDWNAEHRSDYSEWRWGGRVLLGLRWDRGMRLPRGDGDSAR